MAYADPLYTSLPFAYTQPAALAALGILHGLTPPAAETARVLELACASGGNVIPLAARFPRASFTAVDIVEEEIRLAKSNAAALDLSNLTLEVADVVEFADRPATSQFDYIIAHGLLSWAPPPVKAAVFKICRERLSPQGLAAISFNVLPGWRAQQIVRDILRRSVGANAPPLLRAEQAVLLLRQMASKVSNSPYGTIVRQSAERLAEAVPSYLFSEYLAPVNEAFFFDDIVSEAQAHGLHYLTEGELPMAAPETLAPESAGLVRELAAGDALAAQTWLDKVSGRVFRRALFAKRRGQEKPNASALAELHVSGVIQPSPQSRLAFQLESGHIVNAPNDAAAAALAEIGRAYPATIAAANSIAGANGQAMAGALLRLAQMGGLRVSSLPLAVGRQSTSHPRVFELARQEAARGQTWVTTLQHRSYQPPPDILSLLAVFDGQRDRAKLSAVVGEARLTAALATLEREALLMP
ncbi:MAG: class I SAM-dependent methyltransferase [Proteobacteria bacterium]|nr:class I SAM-dependent methyltransferase [Pseudomonadota bacterium]